MHLCFRGIKAPPAFVLDDFHAREILHVTFGSVLTNGTFRGPFFAVLQNNEETYTKLVEAHFKKHFAPFATK